MPLPVPGLPEVTVIQVAPLVAVQEQFESDAVTVTLPVPPDDVADALVGLMPKLQPDAWLTVNVCPATVTVPDRAGPTFAATE